MLDPRKDFGTSTGRSVFEARQIVDVDDVRHAGRAQSSYPVQLIPRKHTGNYPCQKINQTGRILTAKLVASFERST